ncbi:cellulase family glycosylhydrolase [Lachnospiraceae bacterium 62-26]
MKVKFLCILLAAVCCFSACQKPEDPGQTGDVQKEEKAEKSEKEQVEEERNSDTPAPSVNGRLSVRGTQLVDEKGEAVQLKGISTHGLAWFPQYVNEELFGELRKEWNASLIRLAMYTAESGGYCTDGNKEELKELIRRGVEYAARQDMYVIVDWHILSDNDPNLHKAEALAFFDEMTKEFAGCDNVLYEICNEPNGGTSWAEIKSYASEVIPVIRANDADAVIIVGTPNWSQYVNEAAADPLEGFDNIMYTLHFYAATHTDSLRNTMTAAIDAGIPVFVTEYGICDASGNGGIDEAQADAWMQVMDEYKVSCAAWNLSNKEETSAVFRSSVDKVSGFTEEDLSDSGRWLYGMLTEGKSADGKASSAGDESAGGKTAENGQSKVIKNEETELEFDGDIALSDSWNGQYAVDGGVLRISSVDYNGKLDAGGSAEDVGFIISGEPGLAIQ